MRKKIIIIIVNLILIVVFLFLAEFVVFFVEKKFNDKYKTNPPFMIFKKNPSFDIYKNMFREPVGLDYKKEPIFMYGCSFGYGLFLEGNDRPDYILSELTKRPVYNFSLYGEGFQQALYVMQNQEIIAPAPKYVIYIFHYDQIRRLYSQADMFRTEKFLSYKINKNKIIFDTTSPHFIENTYLYRKILQTVLHPHSYYFSTDNAYKKFKLFVDNMNAEIHNKYPDAKFIFVFYDNRYNCLTKKQLEDFKKSENSKFKIIYLPDILGKSFYNRQNRLWDNVHPNSNAWKTVIPEIVKNME